MLEQLKYKNHVNEVFEFGKDGIFVDMNELHDYEWTVTNKGNRIAALNREITKRKLPLVIICGTEAEGVVGKHPGLGMNFFIAHSSFEYCGAKYLYISDQQIKGHANNSLAGTGAVGITYANNRFIMRYVIGV